MAYSNFYLKRVWWRIRETFRFPFVSVFVAILLIGLIENKSILTTLMIIIIFNLNFQNKEVIRK